VNRSLLLVAAALATPLLAQSDARPVPLRLAAHPPAGARNPHYPGNRPPLQPTPLLPLPIGAIDPAGWLREQLRLQAHGFHGHLTEISAFLRKDGNAWLAPDGIGTHGWEEPVYWLKGFAACAYVLGDARMLAEARIWIEGILGSQKADGWFGPDGDRSGLATDLRGRDDLWPNMIALFCLQDWHDHSGDPRVLELMQRYFAYLDALLEDRLLLGYWPRMRGGDLLFSILWLHQRTGDDGLLPLAHKVHRRSAPWREGIVNGHNVNIAQAFGEPATYWMLSGDAADRRAPYASFAQIRETFGQVPGGMFGSDENCREGCTGPRQAVETCGMVEMMLSTERLAWITGDPLWADRCEDVAFNSLPAATTADLRALRYLTAPNMPLSDARSKAPGLQNGGPMLHMNPHIHRCCQHDFGHGWPYYARHAWFATADRGAAALLFTDCRVSLQVADGASVTIAEHTRYPFDGQIAMTIGTQAPVRFPLYLRVPGWCARPELQVAGEDAAVPEGAAGKYLVIEREWRDGDTVRLALPMAVSLRRWRDNFASVSVDRGPLTFSLEIGERAVRDGGTDAWPAWTLEPATPWNYALVLPPGDAAAAFAVEHQPWPGDDRPWTHAGTPIRLRARGRRVPEWQLDHTGLVAELQRSPVASDAPIEAIRLVPMGAARLRISAFPVAARDGEAGQRWTAPPQPLYEAAASHCFGNDTTFALCDGRVPASSDDHTIPRHTFWDHRGTREWLEARFAAPRRVAEVAVYWFDDGPRGGCRVPAAWRLLRRDGERWIPVEGASGFGTDRDRFNVATFAPLDTTALRIEVELREGFSAGVLEWRIE
jgi:hypothetical protein